MPPDRDTLNAAELKRLTKLYEQAQRDILDTIDSATDFGQARRIELLAQIDTILGNLADETGGWIEDNIGTSYERGTTDLIKQMSGLKVALKDATTMSTIDRQAVAALVTETQEAFGASLTTVRKNAAGSMSRAVRESIQDNLATGRILGETRREVSDRIKATLRKDTIVALIDKGGRPWTLDRYAEMLARTKMVEARNTGLANKMVANGYDLVEVSVHMSDHKECAQYEGKILSLTGRTPGYTSLETAKRNGLLHPNCEHQINAVRTEYQAITTAYDSRSGQYVEPFKGNPPAKPTAILTPPKPPRLATPQQSIVRPRSVTMAAAGKQATFKLTQLEGSFIQRSALTIKTSDGRKLPGAGAQTHGYYLPSRHELWQRSVDKAQDRHTFYHELGHALDFGAHKVTGGINGRLIYNGDIPVAIRRDVNAVLARRIQANYKIQGIQLPIAEALKGARGGTMTGMKGGKTVRYTPSARWIKYARRREEVFGDAYAQYRLNPAAFKKYAPDLFAAFERIGRL